MEASDVFPFDRPNRITLPRPAFAGRGHAAIVAVLPASRGNPGRPAYPAGVQRSADDWFHFANVRDSIPPDLHREAPDLARALNPLASRQPPHTHSLGMVTT